MTDVRLILDTSAIVAYCTDWPSAIAVGEPIAEVADENALFGVPTLCLAEALTRLSRLKAAVLDVLVAHPHCQVLDLTDNWRALAYAAARHNGFARGAARLASIEYDASLLTAEPSVYGGPDTDGIIPAG